MGSPDALSWRRGRGMRSLGGFLLMIAFTAVAGSVHAAGDESNAMTAEGLFAEGRRLRSVGKVDEGCAKFEASLKVRAAVGTLLNLADCALERNLIGTAWIRLRQAERLALQNGDTKRQREAASQADAIEPRLPHVRIVVEGATRGLVVRRDDVEIEPAALGTSLPVDPGPHIIHAEAVGHLPFDRTLSLKEREESVVVIPPLRLVPVALTPTQQPTAPRASSSAWVGFTLGAVGAATLITAGVVYLHGWSLERDVEGECPSGRCSSRSVYDQVRGDAQQAETEGVVASVLAGLGGALLTAGVIWLVTGRPSSRTSANRAGLPPTSRSPIASPWNPR